MSFQPSQNLQSKIHLGGDVYAARRDPESDQIWQDDWPEENPETNPITIKPETTSHVAEQLTWVPFPC